MKELRSGLTDEQKLKQSKRVEELHINRLEANSTVKDKYKNFEQDPHVAVSMFWDMSKQVEGNIYYHCYILCYLLILKCILFFIQWKI